MDIEEIKKYSKNKIEADDLIKQVRQQIKETIWEKQNMREGFSETFKPLISQFEKPEDPKQRNIFTQNQEMLRNQLALTEGLKANQKAITDGFSQFERLADMRELPGVEAIEDEEDDKDDQARAPLPKEDKAQATLPKEDKAQAAKAPIAEFDVGYFDKYLNNTETQNLLKSNGYKNLPSYYFDKDVSEVYELIDNVKSDFKDADENIKNTARLENEEGYFIAKPKNENPRSKTIENIKIYNSLSIYLKNLNDLLIFKKQSGSGMFYNNPEELLHRFELLAGSLAAGNNGVLPEYIQIAHRLRDHGIITNNQLNTLLRKVI